MNSTNKYGLEYAGPKKRGWKKRLGCWLWAFVWMLALWLVMWGVFAVAQRVMPRSARNEETRMANEEFVLRHSGFDIPAQRAGFEVPEWVAYGIGGTVVLMIIGLKAWQWIVGPEEAETLAMPPEHDRDFETVRGGDIETCRGCKWCRDPGDGYAGMIRCTHERAGKHGMLTRPSFGVLCAQHSWLADGDGINAPWMRSLKAFFAGRGVRLTDEQCVIIRAKCVPPGATSLPFLSVYLQRELKLRLLMTTLMEIQAICMGPLQPGRAEP